MKRFIMYMLTLSMLVAQVACGNGAEETETQTETGIDGTSDTVETTDTSIREELPDENYGGYTMRVLMRDGAYPDWQGDMFSDKENGDVVSDAVYRRNSAVSERFNVNFELIRSSSNNYETDGIKSILAGDDAYDIIVPHARAAFTYASQKLCYDYNTDLAYVDLDKPWWDQDARTSFEINGKLYAMVGDISYQSIAQTWAMLFNKKLFDEYKLEYPYETVLAGNWTFDEFSKLSAVCSDDLNGNGVLEPASDLYGYVTYQWKGPMQILATSGGRIVSKNESGILAFTVNNERTQEVYTDFFKLINKDSSYLALSKGAPYSYSKVFSEGRAMFIDITLNDISTYRDMEDDFGIIPSPKYDELCQKYYTGVEANTNLFIVPITNPDPIRTSVILEALCAEGSRVVIPAYYDIALQRKYTRDETSVEMLDIIKNGRVFDIGYYYCGDKLGSLGYQLCTYTDNNFASYYAANITASQTALDEINNTYGK